MTDNTQFFEFHVTVLRTTMSMLTAIPSLFYYIGSELSWPGTTYLPENKPDPDPYRIL